MTIDLDTTDVEVYGRHKRGVAFNHQGQRVGRPHVATWADTATVLAADLLAGNEDPRRDAPALLRRALAALPAAARTGTDPDARRRRLLRRAAGPRRPVRRHRVRHRRPADRAAVAAAGRARRGRLDRRDRHGGRAGRGGRLLPQLVARRDPATDPPGPPRRDGRAGQRGSAGPSAAHPAPRPARPARWPSSPTLDAVYGYSFIVTNLDVTTGERAAAVEHWYRHRTQVENVFRDAKHGAALRHLPSGHPEVNRAWMWGALLAASLTGWLHQLTATPAPDGRLLGHGVRDGQAMIATLRHRLIRVPARLVRHAGGLTLRLPPGHDLLAEVLARIRALPATS